jgi:hypothetical protein
VTYGSRVFWIGGSGIAYNYDGIAYNGSGGVPALDRILFYDSDGPPWYEGTGAPYSVMDLRGAGQVSPTSWIICGGMMGAQEVVDRAFLLEYDPIVAGISNEEGLKLELFPNPARDHLWIKSSHKIESLKIYNATGRLLFETNDHNGEVVDISFLVDSGIYFIEVNDLEVKSFSKID